MRVEDILPREKTLVSLSELNTVSEALAKMQHFPFHSVPVTSASPVGHFTGFLDLLDIVYYLGSLVTSPGALNITELTANAQLFAQCRVGSILNSSERNARVPAVESDDLWAVLGRFIDPSQPRVHKICIIRDGYVINVLSQFDLLVSVGRYWSLLPDLGPPVRAIVPAGRTMSYMSETTSAFLGFARMRELGTGCLPIISGAGELLDVLEEKDIVLIAQKEHFSRLLLPVMQYLALGGSKRPPSVVVRPDLPLRMAVAIVLATRVRCIVLGESRHEPQSILTLTDLLIGVWRLEDAMET